MKLAIWYHCILSGGSVPIDTEFACRILQSQMRVLKDSGLLDQADEFYVGINGGEEDVQIASLFASAKAKFIIHGAGMTTEIPTLAHLRHWLPGHEEWKVMYHHIKGVTRPNDPPYDNWRKTMEKAVVTNWRTCVSDLDNGVDACGCYWLLPEECPEKIHDFPFFGGTFWWATAKYLLTLPPLPLATWANRYKAENWIGQGPRRPRIKNYTSGRPL